MAYTTVVGAQVGLHIEQRRDVQEVAKVFQLQSGDELPVHLGRLNITSRCGTMTLRSLQQQQQ